MGTAEEVGRGATVDDGACVGTGLVELTGAGAGEEMTGTELTGAGAGEETTGTELTGATDEATTEADD